MISSAASPAAKITSAAELWTAKTTRVGVVLVIAAFALATQLAVYPNHDVAWVLWGARQMLDGAVWGRDLIEPNPPLAWYLAMPSTWIAGLFGWPIASVFQITVIVAAVVSVAVFDRIVGPLCAEGNRFCHLPTLLGALFLLVLPDRDFAQREHLTIIAVLPYLGLVAARCSGVGAPGVAAVIAVGVAAGLGVALKPYFLLVPLLVEVTAMLLVRRWTFALRPDTVAMGVTVSVYGAWLLLFDRAYVDGVLPLVQAIYWSFDVTWTKVLPPLAVLLLAAMYCVSAAAPRRLALPLVMNAAMIGFMLAYLIQHKGYSYHLYPATVAAALTVSAVLASGAVGRAMRMIGWALLATLLVQAGYEKTEWWHFNRPGGIRTSEITQLIGAINAHAGAGRFAVIAVHPHPAFPAALYVRSAYASRTNSQWFLPAVVQLRTGARAADPRTLALAERGAREFILHDLADVPGVVIVDADSQRHTSSIGNFDFLAFYSEDARFRAAWAPYREVGRIKTWRVFARSEDAAR